MNKKNIFTFKAVILFVFFTTKISYAQSTTFHSRLKIPVDKFIVLNESFTHKATFYRELNEEKISLFYGIYINDSTKLVYSKQLQELPSCRGRVLEDLKEPNKNSTKKAIIQASDLVYLTDTLFKKKVVFNSNKFTVIMLYNESVKRKFSKQYKEVYKYCKYHENEYDLLILVL